MVVRLHELVLLVQLSLQVFDLLLLLVQCALLIVLSLFVIHFELQLVVFDLLLAKLRLQFVHCLFTLIQHFDVFLQLLFLLLELGQLLLLFGEVSLVLSEFGVQAHRLRAELRVSFAYLVFYRGQLLDCLVSEGRYILRFFEFEFELLDLLIIVLF